MGSPIVLFSKSGAKVQYLCDIAKKNIGIIEISVKVWRGVTTYGTAFFYFCGMSYEDIINLPHHVSKRHPQMSMKKRAAQFAPFAAMEGYKESIEESIRENVKLYEPKVDDEWW